jgi:hypothetical protein
VITVILMNANIKNFLNWIFGRKEEANSTPNFYLNIGSIKARLDTRKRILLQNIGGRNIVSTLQESAWKRARGACRVDPSKEPNPHVLIVGMSGMGKSSLFRSMISDISVGGLSAIIFDAHDEHEKAVMAAKGKVYDARYAGLNIFELDGLSVGERIFELTNLLGGVYGLGQVQRSKLSSCIWYVYRKVGATSKNEMVLKNAPTIRNLIDELRIFEMNARTSGEKNMLLNIRSKLSTLDTQTFARTSLPLEKITNGITSFSIQNLRSNEARQIYLHELLKRLYQGMKDNEKEQGIRRYVMIDEAQSLVTSSGGSSILTKMIEEGRKYGVGSIIATHMASVLDRQIITNTATFIAFHSREPREANYVSGVLSGNSPKKLDSVRTALNALKRYQAMVVSGDLREATIVDAPTDWLQKSKQEALRQYATPSDAAVLSALDVPVLEGDARRLLGKRYDELEGMVIDGVVDRFTTYDDGAKETWFMRSGKVPGTEHEVYTRKISRFLTENDIKHMVVGGPGKPDLSAEIDGSRVAIEYETGKKKLEYSMDMFMDRIRDFDALIVITNPAVVVNYARALQRSRAVVGTFEELKQWVKSRELKAKMAGAVNTVSQLQPESPKSTPVIT